MNTKKVPEQVQNKIEELKHLEIELGHLPSQEYDLKQLQSRATDQNFPLVAGQKAARTETLFQEICEELADVGFDFEEIAAQINAVLQYPGGPKYCNAEEVSECL